MDFFNVRYFTRALGRFNSPGPANAGADIMDPQTWNGYSYVRNNPLTYTDPSGQFALSDLFSGLWEAISDFGGAILNWFNLPCGTDFCETGTGVSDINTVALNQVPPSSAQYDYNIGKPTDTYDLNGAHTHYDYTDALDRLTKVTLPIGAQTAYSYPSVTEMDSYQDQNSAGDQALRTRQLYDGLGRLSEADNYESSSQYIATTQTYDALGRPASTTKDPNGLNYSTVYAYDPIGDLLSVTQGSHTRTFAYDTLGRLTGATNLAALFLFSSFVRRLNRRVVCG